MSKDIKFNELLNIRVGDDELFLSGGGDSFIEKLVSVEQWSAKATALKDLFMQTTGSLPEGIDGSLNPEILSEEYCDGYIKRKIVFNIQCNERIDAYILIPDLLQVAAPAVLCLTPTTDIGKEQTIGNGTTEKDSDRAYALHLVKRGYITFTFDWDSAGTRQYPGLEPFDNGPFYRKYPQWSAVGKNIWDIRKAVDYLVSLEEVDASRIASIGHSQGGGATIYAMAMDDRIKVGVSSCGGFPLRMEKNPFNHARNRWWIGRPALRAYCLTGKEFPCDIHELLALCAPRPFLYIAALNDCKYSLEEKDIVAAALKNMNTNIRKVYKLYDVAEKAEMILHLNGHSFVKEQRDKAYEFLDKYL
jgi:dienelactone hydrolase